VTWQPTVVVPAASAARQVKIRIESSADAALAVRLHVATPEPRKLKIATFNIRWYGVGGDIDHPTAETRNPTLKAFVDEHLADADLVVFEEILDAAMLQAEVVPAGWTCSTYENATPKHQFVTGCLAPGLFLTREADDTNLGYEPVAMNTLRPALAGVVRDASTFAPIARLAGVHLKALPNSTDRRLQQVTILGDRLAELDAKKEALPLLVLGDFNAHRSTDTMRDKDDWTLIAETFEQHPELGLARVDYPFENTYRDKDGKAYKLDHMYLSRASVEGVDVVGPCNLAWPADQAAITQHFDQISDHCPVIANITLE
jgi:endonuclease/exonuclease/phosphatase family metal-dependent hydrolase